MITTSDHMVGAFRMTFANRWLGDGHAGHVGSQSPPLPLLGDA